MEIVIHRAPPVAVEQRTLAAIHYNLARTRQARAPGGVAFVPVRSMQVLAILDGEEFVFVDSQHKQHAVLVWRRFRPQERQSLDQPVPFEAAFHHRDAAELQKRLQPELFKALRQLAAKARIDGPATVLRFERPGGT